MLKLIQLLILMVIFVVSSFGCSGQPTDPGVKTDVMIPESHAAEMSV